MQFNNDAVFNQGNPGFIRAGIDDQFAGHRAIPRDLLALMKNLFGFQYAHIGQVVFSQRKHTLYDFGRF